MQEIFSLKNEAETRAFGRELALKFLPGTLLCLSGDLGAGKTTFAQGILSGLGAEKPYTSPTFVLMKQYDLETPSQVGIKRIYHADAYRVEAHDFEIIGFQDWLDDEEGLVILEWPERVKNLLPKERLEISIKSIGETMREIEVHKMSIN
jgi:tRNA threonylcarbamoyladenosine biosynthesis protein TsaE